MLDTKLFLNAIEALEAQGIAREITIQALSEAFETIVKKKHVEGLPDEMVKVDILPDEGRIDIFSIKNVVEEVEDDAIEMAIEEAREIQPEINVGEQIYLKIEIEKFTKHDAMKFKSILRQKIKEAEKAAILSMYSDKIDEIITGHVEKVENRYTLVNIGRTSVVLQDKEKIGNEEFEIGQAIKVYLMNVGSSPDSGITISRACPGFLKRLFEEEIHDVFDGTVIIKDIAREAGERAKVSVFTNDINVDPVGSCIGQGGSKIQKICRQINDEKIDIVQYHDHKGLFIAECLKPAVVKGVAIDENGNATVVVADGELRVAIGKRGVNARLAYKLAKCKIDIKEERQAKEEGISYFTMDEMKKQEEEMIFEKRRQALLEQIAREEEERKKRAEEEANEVSEETYEDVSFEEIEEEYVEEETFVEEKETVVPETKQEVVEEIKPEPEAAEEHVEFKPVMLQPKVSLADLEKQIEEEKKKKNGSGSSFNKKKHKQDEEKETTAKVVKETTRMDIYTQEELEEFEDEYEDDYLEDDEDINYDDYDEYYDED